MKKILLFSVIACLFLFSCKKEKSATGEITPSSKKYAVNFSVSDFSQTITGDAVVKNNAAIKNRTDASVPTSNLASVASVLYYYIFDNSGNTIHSIKQLSTVSNFGNIQDSLATGTYTVVFAAGQTGLGITGVPSAFNALNMALLTYSTNTGTPVLGPWQDTFFQKFTLTVGSGNISQNVTMDRIVGKIQVKILDTVPANANSIVVTFAKEYYQYSFAKDQAIANAYNLTSTTVIPSAIKGTTGYTINTLIGNTVAPMNVSIICYDASNKIIAQAQIASVSCQKNSVTILAGKLFTISNGFQPTLNLSWDTPNNVHF